MKLLSYGIQNLELELKIRQVKGQNVTSTNSFERYRNRYSDQASPISGQ